MDAIWAHANLTVQYRRPDYERMIAEVDQLMEVLK